MDSIKELTNEELMTMLKQTVEFIKFLEKEKDTIENGEENA